jgi:hypothetical protein
MVEPPEREQPDEVMVFPLHILISPDWIAGSQQRLRAGMCFFEAQDRIQIGSTPSDS